MEQDERGSLQEQAQKQNSNLQALIETITQLIAVSRELLARLHAGGKEEPPPPDPQP